MKSDRLIPLTSTHVLIAVGRQMIGDITLC